MLSESWIASQDSNWLEEKNHTILETWICRHLHKRTHLWFRRLEHTWPAQYHTPGIMHTWDPGQYNMLYNQHNHSLPGNLITLESEDLGTKSHSTPGNLYTLAHLGTYTTGKLHTIAYLGTCTMEPLYTWKPEHRRTSGSIHNEVPLGSSSASHTRTLWHTIAHFWICTPRGWPFSCYSRILANNDELRRLRSLTSSRSIRFSQKSRQLATSLGSYISLQWKVWVSRGNGVK